MIFLRIEINGLVFINGIFVPGVDKEVTKSAIFLMWAAELEEIMNKMFNKIQVEHLFYSK